MLLFKTGSGSQLFCLCPPLSSPSWTVHTAGCVEAGRGLIWARGAAHVMAGKGSEIAQGGRGGAEWCWGSLGHRPFGPSPMADSLGGSGENFWCRKLGTWVGVVEGPRPLSLSSCPQVPVRSPDPGFLPGKPADPCLTHSDNNPSCFPAPSGRCLLELGHLGSIAPACPGLRSAQVCGGQEERQQRQGRKPPSLPQLLPKALGCDSQGL